MLSFSRHCRNYSDIFLGIRVYQLPCISKLVKYDFKNGIFFYYCKKKSTLVTMKGKDKQPKAVQSIKNKMTKLYSSLF